MSLLSGGFLESVGAFRTGEFTPPDQTEWRNMSYPLASFVADKNNVRFKFEFTSGTIGNVGNNLYLDDFKIENFTGVESFSNLNTLKIYPNPASDFLYVEFSDGKIDVQNLTLKDVTGKTAFTYAESQLNMSENGLLKLNISDCQPGLYFIQLQTKNGESMVKKLVIK